MEEIKIVASIVWLIWETISGYWTIRWFVNLGTETATVVVVVDEPPIDNLDPRSVKPQMYLR